MKGKLKQVKGITLIALVITIIVLLILAGVSIAMLTGQNGILTQAANAKVEQSHGAVMEGIALAYNEYQIEINAASNTKLASTETVQIQGKEEKALASYSSFLDFLNSKGYIKEGTTDVLDVEALTGSRQALGNGTDTDVYKIEEQDGNYVVNYYDEPTNPEQIWSISNSTETGDVTLEPDTGKEALILVYNVSAGDTIELPYNLKWYDGGNENPATFDFTVDWGDGTAPEHITNADIAKKTTHPYTETKEIKITITGIFESISSYNSENSEDRQGIDKLVRVEQWGTIGLKTIDLSYCSNLTQIVAPTESSFKDLSDVYFANSGIQSIPDKMFLNCTKITRFSGAFDDCNNLQTIGDYAFSGCSSVEDFQSMFRETDSLTTIGNGVFANCTNAIDFAYCFQDCTNLTSIGKGIFDGCDKVERFDATFYGCSNLQGTAPELWLRVPNGEENGYRGVPDGNGCFAGCEKLDNYEEIPYYWKIAVEG